MDRKIDSALVIGASSGIGAAFAEVLAAEGARVALLARRRSEMEKVARGIETAHGEGKALIRVADVRDVAAAPSVIAEVEEALGGLDLVCYAAGVMAKVGPEEFDFEKDDPVLDVNLRAAIAWLNPVAARFQEKRAGVIVGIGSIAGDRGRRAYPSYHAAKAGFATYLESLRNRLSRYGVQVTTIKPGFIDTPMTRGMEGLFWLKSAEEAARWIWKAVRRGAATAYVPARWRFVSWAIRSIPSVVFRRLNI